MKILAAKLADKNELLKQNTGKFLLEVDRLKSRGQFLDTYHRGIKQFCGVERCQARRNNVQRAIKMTVKAFLRDRLKIK